MIQIQDLECSFGSVRAVDGVTFDAPEGQVTGFLGANGAGKSTTLRILLGLARADGGVATIGGKSYADLGGPRQTVGALVDTSFHPGRSGRNHLRCVATAARLPSERVDAVLDLVELQAAADRRVGGYSLGMRQRLALASAMLGDPQVLILDEPANGLDPPGIAWLRALLRRFASDGRTVLISSHGLAEVAQSVDRVAIIDQGRIVFNGPIEEVAATAESVRVRTPQVDRLIQHAAAAGWLVTSIGPNEIEIDGPGPAEVGRLAAGSGIEIHGLSTDTASERLESAFLELTNNAKELAR